MDYIVDPMSGISPLGCYCNCTKNTGPVYSSCGKNYGNCSTFEICVTPTGAKMAPTGIKPKTEI